MIPIILAIIDDAIDIPWYSVFRIMDKPYAAVNHDGCVIVAAYRANVERDRQNKP